MSGVSFMALAGATSGIGGNDAFTKILLHMDGSDGGTTFTDVNAGGTAHTWAAIGNAQLDTSQIKFGTASLLFDGTGDSISTADSADFYFAGNEFTIDCWVRFAALPAGSMASGSGNIFISQWATGSRGWIFGVGTTGAGNYQLSLNYNSAIVVGSNVSLSTGVWYHFAVVRDNTGTDTIRFFLDGVAAGTDTGINGVTIANSTASCIIGNAADTFTANMNGWIDEMRVSNGVARWTSAFTPNSVPYT